MIPTNLVLRFTNFKFIYFLIEFQFHFILCLFEQIRAPKFAIQYRPSICLAHAHHTNAVNRRKKTI